MSQPIIALTCGDPAGIGPEITVKAWEALRSQTVMVWLGDPHHLPPGTPFACIDAPSQAAETMPKALPVLPIEFANKAVPGQPDLQNAHGVQSAIERAVELVQDGALDAICTAPIHKKILQDGAGFEFPGHTEFLSHLAGGADVVMMLASEQLRVVPATIHVALRDVPDLLTPALLRQVITITETGLKEQFGIPSPRLAIAGLNPHAGEGGRMGDEELRWMTGLIEKLQAQGKAVTGPHSADTLFHASARARYDAAICMYHDQALIPIKTLDFDRGVNVTLGLPFIRTSPDHGTAFDIAGKGIANPSSMIEAVKLASKMVKERRG
jgi:4-hydroxythreonine-4-phosphate dehydrogenase